MREIIFKNLTSLNKKRRDLYISETVEKDGIKTITQKHSIYIVGESTKIHGSEELILHNAEDAIKLDRRHVFILKKRDRKLKKDIFICDVVGKFYAVVGSRVFPIAFKHSFQVDFLCTQKT